MIIYVIKRNIDKEDLNHACQLYCSTCTTTLSAGKGVNHISCVWLSSNTCRNETGHTAARNSKVTPHIWSKYMSLSRHRSFTQPTTALVSSAVCQCRLCHHYIPTVEHLQLALITIDVAIRTTRQALVFTLAVQRAAISICITFVRHAERHRNFKYVFPVNTITQHLLTLDRWQTAPHVSLYCLFAASAVSRSWREVFSFPRGARPLSIMQNVHTYSKGSTNELWQLFPLRKSWPLTSIWFKGYEWVELDFHSPTRLHNVHSDSVTSNFTVNNTFLHHAGCRHCMTLKQRMVHYY
jgi:hypothetical protein